jgi:hypothetical protein
MDTLKIFLISQFKQLAYTAVDLPTSRSRSLEFNWKGLWESLILPWHFCKYRGLRWRQRKRRAIIRLNKLQLDVEIVLVKS